MRRLGLFGPFRSPFRPVKLTQPTPKSLQTTEMRWKVEERIRIRIDVLTSCFLQKFASNPGNTVFDLIGSLALATRILWKFRPCSPMRSCPVNSKYPRSRPRQGLLDPCGLAASHCDRVLSSFCRAKLQHPGAQTSATKSLVHKAVHRV